MKVRNMHAYDPETLEYKGLVPTTLDPRASEQAGHDVWMIPANATDVGPNLSKVGEHQVAVYNKERNRWDITDDHRGTEIYDAKSRTFTQWDKIGPIPAWCYTTDNMPYERSVMILLDWTEDGLVVKSQRDTVLTILKDNRKYKRDVKLQEDIKLNDNVFKTDSYSCEDYQRIIVLDVPVPEWVDASGNTVLMTPTLAKTLLKMIQDRKSLLVNETATLIKKDQTASSDQLIKQLVELYK